MRYRILGPMEIEASENGGAPRSCTPHAAKLRVVLATLLVRANEVVSVESLIDELWQDAPPRTAMTTLQVYVSQLRKLLDGADPGHGRAALLTRRPGYLLRVGKDELDATVFESLHERGRRALEADDHATASELQRRAIALWRGPLLSDTPHGTLLDTASVRLAEARTTALDQRIRADLQLGRHRELIAELQSVTAEQPLREEFHAHLMVALYRTGRQADALRVHARLRRTLVDELGIEPGPGLRRLHQRILDGDAALLRPRAASKAPPPPRPVAPPAPVVALPPADQAFTGRTGELAELEGLLRDAPPGASVVVTGMPGTGKTALAVEAAHRMADAFPDGRLFLDLRPGPGAGRPLAPAEAMARLLRRAGGDPHITSDAAELEDSWHRLLTGRRVLLLLDNAASEAQIRPLLPVTAGSTAIITSRRLPAGLAGMRPLVLGPLGEAESAALIGGSTEAADLCGRLPLALRVAAAQLAARPHWTPASLAVRLREESTRLDALRAGDLDVRERLLAAYESCPAPERRAFRLLSLLPPGDPFGPEPAAAVLDTDPAGVLDDLADAHLLTTHDGRYRLPPLLRLLAAERLAAEEPPETVRAATRRMCDTYAAAAESAQAAPDRPTLVRLVRTAYDAALWAQTIRLADALTDHLETHAAWQDWESTHTLALDAAARCGDLAARARMLRSLGDLAWQHRHLDRAAEFYGRARRAAETADDREEYGRALVGLAELRLDTGATTEAAALLRPALAALTAPSPAHPRARYEARRALALLALQSDTPHTPDHPDSARTHFTACLDLATTLHDPRLEAYARRSLRTLPAPSPTAVEIRPGLWRLRRETQRGSQGAEGKRSGGVPAGGGGGAGLGGGVGL